MIWYDGKGIRFRKEDVKVGVLIQLLDRYPHRMIGEDYQFPAVRKIARMVTEKAKPENIHKSIIPFTRPKVDDITTELYPFQKEGVKMMVYLHDLGSNILLADDMGLGKTIQAIIYLAVVKESVPALIVCPATLKMNWLSELEKWTGYKGYILEGRKSEYLSKEFLEKYPIWIANYDILGQEDPKQKKEEQAKRKKAKESGQKYKKKELEVFGWVDEIIKHKFSTIICDEVQYISEPTSLRSRGIIKIGKALPDSRKIFISGTPYETRTAQFFTPLSIIQPSVFKDRWKYLYRYCDPKKNYFGWKFDGLTNGDELHFIISKFMIRRLKKDVLKQLPPKIRSVIPLNVTGKERRIYDNEDYAFLARADEKDKSSRYHNLKKKAYEAKSKQALQWIKEYLEVNDKLVVFVYHISTFQSLMNEFKGIAVGINGGVSIPDREKAVKSFQNNPKIRLFIGQIRAAGVGLTLTKANAVCFLEFGSTVAQHEQAEDRVNRIGQEADSILAYYLILKDSVEEDIMSVLQRRNKSLKKVMDNKDGDKFFDLDDNFDSEVIEQYIRRKRKNLQSKSYNRM